MACTLDSLRREFVDPPFAYRSAPFWSWNDRLQPEEVARQVRDMAAHGMGGFFMHSREGLETPYLGPEWMACVREAVRVASEEGIGAWLYDEDRWPSGAAGGRVPAQGGDPFRAKMLTLEECAAPPASARDLLALFAAVLAEGRIVSARRLDPDAPDLRPGEVVLAFRREVGRASEWFNDDTYADNLNPEAVAAFIDTTYEAYRREVGLEFGRAVPGIFTDEPGVMNEDSRPPRPALPWADGLERYFRERRGHDLLDLLPWLFYEGDLAAKARHDCWYTVSQRFVEAYSRQIGEWCERHGLAFTGHYDCENDLAEAILRAGAIMPHYRYQHVPGIDLLFEQGHEFLTVKQCSSVARQFGRPRVISEMYAGTGWEFSFEGQKWVGDWQYALGVNMRCQHLWLYSLRGCRKRDYPPSFGHGASLKYNRVVEDYFARIGRILSEGEPVRDVLVIHPLATGWSRLGATLESFLEVNDYGAHFNDFLHGLLAAHYDLDLGDEQIMATEARVDGPTLWVGRAPYRAVIVPPGTRTLLASTLELLERYIAAGGTLIAVEPLPDLVEAEPSGRPAALFAHEGVTVVPGAGALPAALEARLRRRASLRHPQGMQASSFLYQQRSLGRCTAYFVVNNDRRNAYDLELDLEGRGRLEEWDPLTGEMRGLPAAEVDGRLRFTARFEPAASRLYLVDPGGSPEPAPAPQPGLALAALNDGAPPNAAFMGPVCPFTRTDPNVLTLDMCSYRLGDGAWSAAMDVWRAQAEIRQALGMRQVYYNGLPQRYRWALEPHPADGAPVGLRFSFQVRDAPLKPAFLLVEGASQFAIRLNGEAIPSESVGWYLDRSLHQVPLPPLRPGENVLELSCAYTNAMELEDCYLLGDFAVATDRAIVAEPSTLRLGDWTLQGYPHYAGSIVYHAPFEHVSGDRVRVFLGACLAVHVAVHINGHAAGHIPWASADGLDITPHLCPGINDVGIEVVSSPRNMLGPLHLAAGHERATNWRSFRREDATYTPEYVLRPWGLVGPVRFQRE